MEDDCKVCRKWEEDIYWTNFRSFSFFQTLSPGFDLQLAIPRNFSNNLREKLPENVTLKGPSGATWNIGLITTGETLFFRNGWKAFVEDHSLEENDVLFFTYHQDSQFDVKIFNGQSLCERATSYFVRKCEHKELDDGSQARRSLRKRPEEVIHASSHNPVHAIFAKRSKNVGNATPLLVGPQSHGRISKEANQGRSHLEEKINSVTKGSSVGTYPLQYVSTRRPVSPEEKAQASKMANAASTKDSCIRVMRSSNVYKRFYLLFPAEWAKSHLPHKSQELLLCVKENGSIKERRWPARFYYRGSGGMLTNGWKDFAVENNLEEFDVCLFELASGDDNMNIIIEVSIFRVVDEVSQLTRVTSRRGRQPKYLRRGSD
ncbi:hypothetical protein NMG60_11016351 [Bertholletia excelsa]